MAFVVPRDGAIAAVTVVVPLKTTELLSWGHSEEQLRTRSAARGTAAVKLRSHGENGNARVGFGFPCSQMKKVILCPLSVC